MSHVRDIRDIIKPYIRLTSPIRDISTSGTYELSIVLLKPSFGSAISVRKCLATYVFLVTSCQLGTCFETDARAYLPVPVSTSAEFQLF
jgi:hypothetical protein